MKLEPINLEVVTTSRHTRYNHSQKRREKRARSRKRGGRFMSDEDYLSRRIVGVDGEGVTRDDGSHDYIMLAVSGAPSLRKPGNVALSRREILTYLWTTLEPDDLNVIYGGSYDFNMWVKGTDAKTLTYLYHSGFLGQGALLDGFMVKWSKGKKFVISKGGRSVTIYDTIAFFQQSFINACDSVLKTYEGRNFLVKQKAARGTFNPDDADEISRYNNLEVDLLVRLIETLREHLNDAGYRPREWYGPGALASAVLTSEGIKSAMAVTPDRVRSAARKAYAGGRFEMFKYGDSCLPVWEYDINSAYPAAIQKLPNLQQGQWIHHDSDVGALPFALYHVRYRKLLDWADDDSQLDVVNPGPFFYRMPHGAIAYPPVVDNWVWSPEVDAARLYVEKYGGELEITECWEFKRDPGSKLPFEFVGPLYAKRQNAKAARLGVQIAYKLILTSLYGKLAQQVGYVPATDKHPAKIPPFHQIEWAGYVTSYARALILKAITLDRDAVIAVETDALFTTHPLDLPLNGGLGAWKETRFDNLTYVQSGHYYADETDAGPIIKCRGIDKGEVTRDDIQQLLQSDGSHQLVAPLTRFIGAGTGLVRGLGIWCRWLTENRTLSLYPTGKRIHSYCAACRDDGALGHDWHQTMVPVPGGVSSEFPIAWENPNPAMQVLEDARGIVNEYED